MELIPVEPLLIEVSEAERDALRLARGGHSTKAGSTEHRLFERMADKGLVNDVMGTCDEMSWKLTRDGITAIS